MQASPPSLGPHGNSLTGKDRYLTWSVSLILALALMGYPIASSGAELLGVGNEVLNYPIRGIVILLSGILFLIAFPQGDFRVPKLIALFLIFYSVRLLVDFNLIDRVIITRDTLIFFGTLVIPALAMGSTWRHYHESNAALVMAGLGAVACTLILFALLRGLGLSATIDLGSRAWLENLNPITIAYTGIWTALAAYSARQFCSASFSLFVLWPLVALGIITFLLGGSRGPVIGLGLFLGLRALISGRSALATLLFSGAMVTVAAEKFADLAIFQRFTNLATDPSVLERLLIQKRSWDQATDSPLWGSAYLELTTLSYPHNLLIEAFMALGVIGGLAMLAIQVNLLRATITMMGAGYILLPGLASMAIADAWISGSIFGSGDFFILAVASHFFAARCRAVGKTQRREEIQRTNPFPYQESHS